MALKDQALSELLGWCRHYAIDKTPWGADSAQVVERECARKNLKPYYPTSGEDLEAYYRAV